MISEIKFDSEFMVDFDYSDIDLYEMYCSIVQKSCIKIHMYLEYITIVYELDGVFHENKIDKEFFYTVKNGEKFFNTIILESKTIQLAVKKIKSFIVMMLMLYGYDMDGSFEKNSIPYFLSTDVSIDILNNISNCNR